MQKIKLDIVSDVVCPWCYIGYGRLQRAMSELNGELEFEIAWHPFELNPEMVPEGEDISDHIMRKYGIGRADMERNRENISGLAAELGFDIRMGDDRRIYNTFDAHRVLHWAELQGKQEAFKIALFREYFTEGRNPSDPEVLRRTAESLGLDGAEVTAVLESDRYAAEVRAEEQQYTSAGITGVPAFIVNDKYLISGAQDPASFVNAFRRIAAEAA